jgi:hypothetical protein
MRTANTSHLPSFAASNSTTENTYNLSILDSTSHLLMLSPLASQCTAARLSTSICVPSRLCAILKSKSRLNCFESAGNLSLPPIPPLPNSSSPRFKANSNVRKSRPMMLPDDNPILSPPSLQQTMRHPLSPANLANQTPPNKPKSLVDCHHHLRRRLTTPKSFVSVAKSKATDFETARLRPASIGVG